MSRANAEIRVSERRGAVHFAVSILLNVVVFVVVGPLVGCITFIFLLGAISVNMLEAPLSAAYTLATFSFLGIGFAYVLGWSAAAATGAAVAIASIWLRVPLVLYLVAFFIGAVASVFFAAYRWNQLDGAMAVLVYALAGGVAAVVCTRLARPFRMVPRESGS